MRETGTIANLKKGKGQLAYLHRFGIGKVIHNSTEGLAIVYKPTYLASELEHSRYIKSDRASLAAFTDEVWAETTVIKKDGIYAMTGENASVVSCFTPFDGLDLEIPLKRQVTSPYGLGALKMIQWKIWGEFKDYALFKEALDTAGDDYRYGYLEHRYDPFGEIYINNREGEVIAMNPYKVFATNTTVVRGVRGRFTHSIPKRVLAQFLYAWDTKKDAKDTLEISKGTLDGQEYLRGILWDRFGRQKLIGIWDNMQKSKVIERVATYLDEMGPWELGTLSTQLVRAIHADIKKAKRERDKGTKIFVTFKTGEVRVRTEIGASVYETNYINRGWKSEKVLSVDAETAPFYLEKALTLYSSTKARDPKPEDAANPYYLYPVYWTAEVPRTEWVYLTSPSYPLAEVRYQGGQGE